MDTIGQLLDIRIQEAAQKISGSQMEVRFCILQDPCQPRQMLTARDACTWSATSFSAGVLVCFTLVTYTP